MTQVELNAAHLALDLDWLRQLIQWRVESYIGGHSNLSSIDLLLQPPTLNKKASPYSDFHRRHQSTPADRILILLALAPYLRPQVLEPFLAIRRENGRNLTEFGGIHNQNSHGFLPTGETALFLLAGDKLRDRIDYLPLLTKSHWLFADHHLDLKTSQPGEPILNHLLVPGPEILEAFTHGRPYQPDFGEGFPAKKIKTTLDWDDLILEGQTRKEIGEILAWVKHGQTLMEDWGMKKRLKPGFRALFYGPPGTGKTLTASLLGKETNREVYRIDLSMVVSKYIGETEKNLERVFKKANDRDWLLFFDEADALFGKRTKVRDAHDRFANQEVSYLLQRVEDFNGIVILASNDKDNIDEAFSRRFQSMIQFPMPKAPERLRLWESNLPPQAKLDSQVNLKQIAQQFELSGGSIMNVVRSLALNAVRRDPPTISNRDFMDGLKKEFSKQGRLL